MQIDKTFKWVLILFLVYALFNAPGSKDTLREGFNTANNALSLTKTPEELTKDEKFEGTLVEKYLSNVAVNVLKTPEGRAFFENLVTPINLGIQGEKSVFNMPNEKIMSSLFNISTTAPGKGNSACCGHFVQFSYETMNNDNIIIEKRKTHIARTGNREIMPALENIITGMKVGETRTALSPGEFAYDGKKFRKEDVRFGEPIKFNVTLLDIQPNFFIKADDVKIFDDTIAYQLPLLCGDVVKFRAKIMKFNGDIIYDSNKQLNGNKISMRIGNQNFPAIFSYALHKKIPVGTRSIITPGKYFKAMIGNDVNHIFNGKYKMPNKKEHFLVEFYDIEPSRQLGVPRS